MYYYVPGRQSTATDNRAAAIQPISSRQQAMTQEADSLALAHRTPYGHGPFAKPPVLSIVRSSGGQSRFGLAPPRSLGHSRRACGGMVGVGSSRLLVPSSEKITKNNFLSSLQDGGFHTTTGLAQKVSAKRSESVEAGTVRSVQDFTTHQNPTLGTTTLALAGCGAAKAQGGSVII
ncbi:hypothetical protein IAQ61_007349 [Plenodomus lingam]|uniref:uncharacterized protein n=1 Tax=Leptosphaeria maculans TaxID=5022 RepID=UPI003327759F|nr:hypothetical protein IAQ61_007349 [Plenodomus lingam]